MHFNAQEEKCPSLVTTKEIVCNTSTATALVTKYQLITISNHLVRHCTSGDKTFGYLLPVTPVTR